MDKILRLARILQAGDRSDGLKLGSVVKDQRIAARASWNDLWPIFNTTVCGILLAKNAGLQ
ncbi:MAG: hypothetical protein JNL18_05595 [Planctomycetaceae bacterium]|nr:hypothetical protein [Planctomycetaceae bacterium]